MDKVSVSSHQSYGSRVGNSLRNILVWIVLVIGSIRLLARNENNYIQHKRAYEKWEAIVQETVTNQINPELDQQEIHVYGEISSNDKALQDTAFWIITDDLKLKRTVEMYQWYEESSTSDTDNLWWSKDTEITYTYDTKWSDSPIDSSNFHSSNGYENPSTWEYESDQRAKEPIILWAYTLTDVFVNQLTDYKTLDLSEQNIIIPENYKSATDQTTTTKTSETTTIEDNNNSYLYWDNENSSEENTTTKNTNTANPSNEKFHINGNQIYIWLDPAKPAVWDLRITFSSVKPWAVSIVWKQSGNELSSYPIDGININLLENGNISASDMFLHAQQANKNLLWILRLLWLILMYCGFSAMFSFIETIAKVLPFLANIIWVWTGIIALWLTLIIGFLTIWIAWLVVRPVIWICCLVVVAIWIFLLVKAKKNKKKDTPKEEIKE